MHDKTKCENRKKAVLIDIINASLVIGFTFSFCVVFECAAIRSRNNPLCSVI